VVARVAQWRPGEEVAEMMRARIDSKIVRRLAGVVVIVAVWLTPTAARQSTTPDPFAPLTHLLGQWQGTTEGQPGKGTVAREYLRALNDRFIRVRNRSVYPPQEKNPKGEVHEDEGFLSVDRARKVLVFRQFHVEGFVNQYVESPESTSTRLVFTSEAIENIPSGWRARETYVFKGPDAFEEIFELSEPGKDFAIYSRATLTRVQ
jgi:hypothetical protein